MSRGGRGNRCRPQLECLEGRDVPAAGVLDPSFGVGGVVVRNLWFGEDGQDVVRQPNGKLVVAGWSAVNPRSDNSSDFALLRLNHDGSPDATFGTGGAVITDFAGGHDMAFAAAIQPDGKIVAAGSIGTFVTHFALARYNPDGSLDTSFGVGGRVVTNFGGSEAISAVRVQPDGKIVAAGSAALPDSGHDGFALARYNADGSLDATFGVGGLVLTDLGPGGGFGQAMALQPDGKIVVAGLDLGGRQSFVLARYNADGSPDSGFGLGGLVVTPAPPETSGEDARAVAVQPDGKIVAGGVAASRADSSADIALARYNPDGSLDATFGGDGWVTRNLVLDESIQDIALQPDGMIVVAGPSTGNSFVARFAADGTPDAAFGTDGWVMNDFAPFDNDHFDAVLLEPDGSIVASGRIDKNFLIARYLAASEPPAFTSPAVTTFAVGDPGKFLFTTTGVPEAVVSLEGDLPRGVKFVYDGNGNGNAVLRGTPAPGTAGLYEFRLVARNAVAPAAVQTFTLRVREDRDPELVGVGVQGGQRQRSLLTFIDVAFTGPVRALPGAFRLEQAGGGPVPLRQRVFRQGNGLVVVRLTFATGNRVPNALGDGRYVLTVNGSRILGADGQPLGGGTEVGFSRVYGDTDGDGTFDRLDLARLRRVLHHEGDWRRWEALFAPVTDEDADRLASLIARLAALTGLLA